MRHISLSILCSLFLCVTFLSTGAAQSNTTGLSVYFSSQHQPNLSTYADYTPHILDVLTFTLYVQKPDEHQSSHITITLSHITNYTGICLNAAFEPLPPGNPNADLTTMTAPDLAFLTLAEQRQYNTTPGLRFSGDRDTLTVSWDNKIQGPVYIYLLCMDSAAYGLFTATLYRKNSYVLPIPWDVTSEYTTPHNKISDRYDASYPGSNIAGNISDTESGPAGNMHSGDGFSYWERIPGVLYQQRSHSSQTHGEGCLRP